MEFSYLAAKYVNPGQGVQINQNCFFCRFVLAIK